MTWRKYPSKSCVLGPEGGGREGAREGGMSERKG
jgi:hypothetical protein